MPGVNSPAEQYLLNAIRQMQQQIAALQRQQAFGITDSNGQLRHFAGAQWVDETTGGIVPPNQDGAIPSDTYGMAVFDANGNLVVLMGEMADGKYGMEVFDAAGNPRTRLGQLPDGDYGTAIYDQNNDGGYVELNVPVVAGPSGTLTTSSTSFVPLAGSPTLTFSVGASGKALVTLAGQLAISGSTSSSFAQAQAQLYVDGTALGPTLVSSISTNTGSLGTIVGSAISQLLTGLSQGPHTLTVEYQSVNGQSASFEEMVLTAIPY